MRRLAVLLCLAAALGTGAVAGAQQPSDPPDPGIANGDEQRALDAARARWRAAGPRSYRMRMTLGCFCAPPAGEEHRIVVRRGRPVRPPEHLREAATVPRLHAIVQGAIDDRVAQLDVVYDARGVPRRIAVDRHRFVADEEFSYTVRRFAAGLGR
jgi:hypothetical protein